MNELGSYRDVLSPALVVAWPHVAAAAPDDSALMGGTGLAIHLRHRMSHDLDLFTTRRFDPGKVEQRLRARGEFVATLKGEGTLNGTFGGVRVQFLWARGQQVLEFPKVVAGMRVGSLPDIAATKLNAIAGRAQLRDYFDLMCIEQGARLRVEDGMRLFMARYGVDTCHESVFAVLRGLGYLDDVPDDPGLSEEHGLAIRSRVVGYWTKRQRQIISSLGMAL